MISLALESELFGDFHHPVDEDDSHVPLHLLSVEIIRIYCVGGVKSAQVGNEVEVNLLLVGCFLVEQKQLVCLQEWVR